MKKVSVVVPCYNAAEYLDQCVTCLLRQTIGVDNLEIILVDDASLDGGETRNQIMKYEEKFPETVTAVFLDQNLRQGGARNAGVLYAGGEYLTFCDADDWLLEEALAHSYDVAKRYDADVVEFSRIDVVERDISAGIKNEGRDELILLDTDEKKKKFLVDSRNVFGSQNKLFRLSMIQENQIRFAEHLIFEEPSFMVQIWLCEKRHYFLDRQFYVCFLSPGSTMRSDWEREHKWDNISVWVFLMENLFRKGMMDRFYEELEYLFFDWGFGLSLCLPLQKNCMLTKEEVRSLAGITISMFPNILQNPYVTKESNWNYFLRTILEKEILGGGITDTDIQEVVVFLRNYL